MLLALFLAALLAPAHAASRSAPITNPRPNLAIPTALTPVYPTEAPIIVSLAAVRLAPAQADAALQSARPLTAQALPSTPIVPSDIGVVSQAASVGGIQESWDAGQAAFDGAHPTPEAYLEIAASLPGRAAGIAASNARKIRLLARRTARRGWTGLRPARVPKLEPPPYKAALHVLSPSETPRVSVLRALRHAFGGWASGTKSLRVPLAYSDHWVLLSLCLAPDLLFGTLGISIHPGFFALSAVWMLLTLLGFLHMLEIRDGAKVARNAARYGKETELPIDARLMSLVEDFERETGWSVSWRDSRKNQVLVETDTLQRRLYLSIGWVLSSERRSDRRRLAYLDNALKIVKRAIALAASP